MEIPVGIVRVTTSIGNNVLCLMIEKTLINLFGELHTDITQVDFIGGVIVGNNHNDVGLLPLDIINLARQLGLDIP